MRRRKKKKEKKSESIFHDGNNSMKQTIKDIKKLAAELDKHNLAKNIFK